MRRTSDRLVFRQLQLLGDDPRLDRPIAGSVDEFENRFFKSFHNGMPQAA